MNDARTLMLRRIQAGLAVNGALLEAQAAAFPPPHPQGPFSITDLDVVGQFQAELTALHAQVYLCDGADAAREQLLALVAAAQARQAITWAASELPLPDVLPALQAAGVTLVDQQVLGLADRALRYAELEAVPVCITGADAAIAESGTLLLVSGRGRGRLASLLPAMHIALLPVDRIVRTLPDALDLVRTRFGASVFQDRSNLTLITGPSRTADIELSLTLGVHGPRDIHVIVIR